MTPRLFEIEEVKVQTKNLAKKRKAYLKLFKREFLGTSRNQKQCKILNEEDITFNYGSDNRIVKAFTRNPLRIYNGALGYEITYFLDKFEYDQNKSTLSFEGDIVFNEDLAIKQSTDESYTTRRKHAYLGSCMHFFRALWDNNLEMSGFRVVRITSDISIFGNPSNEESEVIVKHGGFVMIGLFLCTILMAVSFHNFLHLPPVLGMMTGLGVLKLFAYYLKRKETGKLEAASLQHLEDSDMKEVALHDDEENEEAEQRQPGYDIFNILARAEWDTLMFFYGVILCVGGLGTLGYLAMISDMMYSGTGVMGTGTTGANIIVGVLSAIVDNIPVMFAVLTMNPDMSLGQWLLVTLTAGVGGSMLSIGSAAGVALMGQARGMYTFFAHLKWSWAIALGYAASIWVHLLINADLMDVAINSAKPMH